jgi:DNA-binding MarR family transcriptional regulator
MTSDEMLDLMEMGRQTIEECKTVAMADGLGNVPETFFTISAIIDRDAGCAKVSDIAENMVLTQQAVGKCLKDMANRGFIVIKQSPKDKRAKLAGLTMTGQQLVVIFALVCSKWSG